MTTPQIDEINDRSAWSAAQLEADPQWRYVLSASESDVIHRATEVCRAGGLEFGDVSKETFLVPELRSMVSALANELEFGRGVVVIRGLPIDGYDDAALRIAYAGIVAHFGTLISQNSKGQLMAEVSDRGNDLTQTNTRGYSTRARLGPHSDMCDMTALLCVRTALSGGESQVASATSVFNRIRATHPEHLGPLLRGFHHDLRGEGPTAKIDEVTHHRVPVFSYSEGRLSCGFNPKISESGSIKRGYAFTAADRAAVDCISALAADPQWSHAMWLERGDIQLVNNHAVLHSRNEYVDGDEPSQRRCLYRAWLRPHLLRALPPEFADRYNTGPHSGVAVGEGAEYVF